MTRTSNPASDRAPALAAPARAADCHIHVFDPRFQPPVPGVPNAAVGDYRRLQQRIGTSRVVIVTPRNYGTDWPHPSEAHKPDYAALFDLLAAWAPDEATRDRILVANPERLYGYAAT